MFKTQYLLRDPEPRLKKMRCAMHIGMRSIDIFLWEADYSDDKNATNID